MKLSQTLGPKAYAAAIAICLAAPTLAFAQPSGFRDGIEFRGQEPTLPRIGRTTQIPVTPDRQPELEVERPITTNPVTTDDHRRIETLRKIDKEIKSRTVTGPAVEQPDHAKEYGLLSLDPKKSSVLTLEHYRAVRGAGISAETAAMLFDSPTALTSVSTTMTLLSREDISTAFPNLRFSDLVRSSGSMTDPMMIESTMSDALITAVRYAEFNGIPKSEIRTLTPAEWGLVDREEVEEIGRRLGLSKDEIERLFVYPIAVGDQPVIGIRRPGDPKVQSVGGDPVDGPGFSDAYPEDIERWMSAGASDPDSRTPFGAPTRIDDRVTAVEERTFGEGAAQKICGAPGATPCFHPAVALHNNGSVQCSGVLVGRRWVLSAAHCVCDSLPIHASIGPAVPTRGRPLPFDTATTSVTSDVRFFPETDAKRGLGEFCSRRKEERQAGIGSLASKAFEIGDLVLIRLAGDLTFRVRNRLTGSIQILPPMTATISHQTFLPLIAKAEVAGFGQSDWQSRGGDKTFVRLVHDKQACGRSDAPKCLKTMEIVLNDPQGKSDSCFGDSGAAAYLPTSDLQGRPIAIAILSRGLSPVCGPGGIYVSLASSKVIEWLEAVVEDVSVTAPTVAQVEETKK